MFTSLVIEYGATALLLFAFLVTCAVLWDVRPPRGPHH